MDGPRIAAGRFTDRVVTLADGREVHARLRPGTGVPIVFLHGLLDTANGWDGVVRRLRRPSIAVNLAGFGGSSLPVRPAFSAYADDVIQTLDALAPGGSFMLVGHSLGGGVATAIAERIPDRVRALVLLAPAGFGRIRLAEAVSLPGVRDVAQVVMPLALGSRLTLDLAYRTMIGNGMAPEEGVIERVVDGRGSLVPSAREATKAVVRAGLSRHGFRHRTVGYDGPVVAVWGDRDRLVPMSHLAGVAEAFPHVEASVWPGMGHHPQHERPDELVALLRRVYNDAARRAAPAPQVWGAA